MRAVARRGWVGILMASTALLGAQDYSVLRINEVIADNETRTPRDIGNGTPDMVEIWNTGSVPLDLGLDTPNQSVALSDTMDLPPPTALWTFRRFGSMYHDRILPGDGLVVYLDSNESENFCEPHASFELASDGSEPITLWGPIVGGTRQIIDQVWLPPLPPDVSFGRSPDGEGAAPVPLEQVFDNFVYFPPEEVTLGSCIEVASKCSDGRNRRLCRGQPNGTGGNLKPRVERSVHSTNSPIGGQAIDFTVRVEDDQEPTPPNIAGVEVVYRVDGGPEQTSSFVWDSGAGVIHADLVDDLGNVTGTNPFNMWTLWRGSIPGQPAGSRVEFYFRVTDIEGSTDTSPETLCPAGVGPCNREFGGPGCEVDELDVTCSMPEVAGERYVSCRKPFTYAVGYSPRGDLGSVVINEVLARQDGVYCDPSEPPGACDVADNCPTDRPDCCKCRDDLIELHNTSSVPVDLSGTWLSSSPFGPQAWQFPPGSVIGPVTEPGEYLLVWIDNDGAKCPDPGRPVLEQPCFWECPDPTDPAMGSYHTNFALESQRDQIFLFDDEANGFGVIHGTAFGRQTLNRSLSLIPNGERGGSWVETTPTLGLTNAAVEKLFLRGDADNNCVVEITDAVFLLNYLFSGAEAPSCPDAADPDDSGDLVITDGIYILNYLFLGSEAPKPPGPDIAGPDPTADELPDCAEADCPT